MSLSDNRVLLSNAHGAALVELAFIIPFLLLTFIWLTETGRVVQNVEWIPQSGYDAAMRAAALPPEISGAAVRAQFNSLAGFQERGMHESTLTSTRDENGQTVAVNVSSQLEPLIQFLGLGISRRIVAPTYYLWNSALPSGAGSTTPKCDCDDASACSGSGGANECPNVQVVPISRPGQQGCFSAEMPVTLADLTVKPIVEVQVGDSVLAYDLIAKHTVAATVEALHSYHVSEYYILNRNLKTTAFHPFYANGTWKRVGNLRVGDKFMTQEGKIAVLTSKTLVRRPLDVYNLSVAGQHNYFVKGLLVHNKNVIQEYEPGGGGEGDYFP